MLPHLALVHVLAPVLSRHESLLAGALAAPALLAVPAVRVGAAARVAELVHADLPLEAVLVRPADLEAHPLQALLPAGALRVRGALGHAVALVAGRLGVHLRAGLGAAGLRDAHAALLSGRHAGESLRALADVPSGLGPEAFRVGPALDLAGVPALPADAGEPPPVAGGHALGVGGAALDADAAEAGLSLPTLAVVGADGLALALGTLAATAAGDAANLTR